MHGGELWTFSLSQMLSYIGVNMQVSYLFATAAGTRQCYTGLIGGRRYSLRKRQRGCHHALSHDALSASVHCPSTRGVSLDYEGQ